MFALAHGAGNDVFYYGDWIKTPGVAICSCNDGLRSVIFKLEATDIKSEIDYKPVMAERNALPEYAEGVLTRKYKVIIKGKEKKIFLDKQTNRWFVEKPLY